MLISVYLALGMSVVSAVIGFAIAAVIGRSQPAAQVETGPTQGQQDQEENKRKERDLDRMVASLYELTSHVDSQVGQHSHRINEINTSLEAPVTDGSAAALDAGKQLISANEKLQQDLEEAKQEIQRQRQVMDKCMMESRVDALTGLSNRRALDHELIRVFADRRRTGSMFSLLMLDIDHFKRVNDTYGHMVGDQLLKNVSRSFQETLRESDFVARYGGEEFVAILPKTSLEDACKTAERVRRVIANTVNRVGDLDLQITTSIGVKEVQNAETDVELLQATDKSLYAAKHGGRNCCYYSDGNSHRRYVPEVENAAADEASAELVGQELVSAS